MSAIKHETPWMRALRVGALVVSVENQKLPSMQEAEVTDERKPFYKK